MAQFEAFKVYEDAAYEEKFAKIEEKLKAKSTSFVYKGELTYLICWIIWLIIDHVGTAEDRFVTKREVAELERQGIIPKHEPRREEPSPVPSPMSVEKDFENAYNEDVLRRVVKGQDDFFAMEEYSMDIYKYLRQHEVRKLIIFKK